MVNELIQQLVAQLGVNRQQAEGGVGLLLKVARDKLAAGDFDEILKAVPNAEALLAAAPAGGGGGMLGGLASALGGGRLGTLAELAAGFGKLGVSTDVARQFGPVVLEYLQQHGSPRAMEIIRKLLG